MKDVSSVPVHHLLSSVVVVTQLHAYILEELEDVVYVKGDPVLVDYTKKEIIPWPHGHIIKILR